MAINISNSTGTSNATDIFTQGHCSSTNCSDIIFYLNDITILPYWVEINISTGITGKVWLNLTGNGPVYMYYNATGKTSLSNGTETFQLYDDFEPHTIAALNGQNNWSGNVNYLVENTLSHSPTKGVNVNAVGGDITILKYFKINKNIEISGWIQTTSTLRVIGMNVYENSNAIATSYYDSGNFLDNGAVCSACLSANTWYKIVMKNFATSTHDVYVYNTNGVLVTSGIGRNNLIAISTGLNFAGLRSLITTESNTYDDVIIKDFSLTPPVFLTWGPENPIFYNNFTNDATLNFSVLSNYPISFVYRITSVTWYQNNNLFNSTSTVADYSYFNVSLPSNSTIKANLGGINVTNWNVTVMTYPFSSQTPLNSSTGTNTPTLAAQEWPSQPPYTYQVSTDNQFINIVASGTGTATAGNITSGVISLSSGITYYWRYRNGNGDYTPYFIYTTTAAPVTPGSFNITVFDEQAWNSRIMTFSAQIYNSTYTLNKTTITGWVNFSSSEVSSGEYLVRIIPNSSYASRSVLATSPTNVTLYIPSTSNTVDTVAFYLLDYTNNFPWQQSILALTKNNSVMHSAYFDADAKVAAYLIRGDSYGVTVINGANLRNWGNYISTASGNVEVVIMDIGVNSTLRNPLVYNVTWNTSDITLRWSDAFSFMNNMNFTIFKGAGKTQVHQLITTVSYGTSQYIVTNNSDIYYVVISASTNNGFRNQSYVIDYRAGQSATEEESPELYTWSYGSVTIPAWVKNAFAVVALMILAGSFGAMHRGEGAIITGIMSLVFWKWTWLSATGAGVGFLGALVLFAVLYHLETKRKGGSYF